MLPGHGQTVNELRAHPNKDGIVASCSVDLTVIIWNVTQSEYLVRLGGFRGHRNQLLSLVYFNFDYSRFFLKIHISRIGQIVAVTS